MTTKITPAFLRDLRPEIEAALECLGEKHGITFKVGNGKYGSGNFEFKLEGIAEGGLTKEAETFKMFAEFWGFKAEDLGATFNGYGRDVYTIVGARSRSDKIIVEKMGKQYLMPKQQVLDLLTKTRQSTAA